MLAANASTQDAHAGERLADALPYAEQMIVGGVFDCDVLTKVTQAFARIHAIGCKDNEATSEQVEELADSDDAAGWVALQASGEVWNASVRVRRDDM